MANEVTKRERDCLVSLKEDSSRDFPMRLHEIASIMKVKPPTALNVVKRLRDKGLVEARDGMVLLTEKGNEVTKGILMVHRTYEALFCQSGRPNSNACMEASEIDFIIPKENAKLILKRIDNPATCPHGKPIMED